MKRSKQKAELGERGDCSCLSNGNQDVCHRKQRLSVKAAARATQLAIQALHQNKWFFFSLHYCSGGGGGGGQMNERQHCVAALTQPGGR